MRTSTLRWWATAQQDPQREMLIYERRDVPAGVVTFFDIDRAAGSAWWGYYLDNAGLTARGELMPAWIDIQRKAIRYAFDELSLQTLEGEVLSANDAVRRLNRRHGFTEVGGAPVTSTARRPRSSASGCRPLTCAEQPARRRGRGDGGVNRSATVAKWRLLG